jgi:hypothetical protein
VRETDRDRRTDMFGWQKVTQWQWRWQGRWRGVWRTGNECGLQVGATMCAGSLWPLRETRTTRVFLLVEPTLILTPRCQELPCMPGRVGSSKPRSLIKDGVNVLVHTVLVQPHTDYKAPESALHIYRSPSSPLSDPPPFLHTFELSITPHQICLPCLQVTGALPPPTSRRGVKAC